MANRCELVLIPKNRNLSHARMSSPVIIRAEDDALQHFRFDPGERTWLEHQFTNAHILVVSNMMKVENDRIGFSAIDAWMSLQVLPDKLRIALTELLCILGVPGLDLVSMTLIPSTLSLSLCHRTLDVRVRWKIRARPAILSHAVRRDGALRIY